MGEFSPFKRVPAFSKREKKESHYIVRFLNFLYL